MAVKIALPAGHEYTPQVGDEVVVDAGARASVSHVYPDNAQATVWLGAPWNMYLTLSWARLAPVDGMEKNDKWDLDYA